MSTRAKTCIKIALILSAALYIVALFLPGIDFASGRSDPILGYKCLLFGGLYYIPLLLFMFDLYALAWTANITLLFSVIVLIRLLRAKPITVGVRRVAIASLIGCVLALAAFLPHEELPNTGSGSNDTWHAQAGAYVWLAAVSLPAVTLSYNVLFGKRRSVSVASQKQQPSDNAQSGDIPGND